MHYNIFYNGCSLAYGQRIAGEDAEDIHPNHEYYEYRLKNRYSQIISDATNLTHCNISYPGVSNDWILETTVNWFEEGNTCDLAIIQWTSPFRFVYYNQKGERINIRGRHIFEDKDWLEYAKIDTEENQQYRFDMFQYWMDYFLKDKCNVIYLQPRKCKVNLKYYDTALYPKNYSTETHYMFVGDNPIFDDPHKGRHPDTEGHRNIAEYLLNIMKIRGYCSL